MATNTVYQEVDRAQHQEGPKGGLWMASSRRKDPEAPKVVPSPTTVISCFVH
jgi:hypothetical protein